VVIKGFIGLVLAAAFVAAVLIADYHRGPLASAVPANDNLANATPVTIPLNANGIVATADTTGATTEAGENVPACQASFGASVWFRWVAPANDVVLSTLGSSFNTVINVYTGAAFPLTPIASSCNDDFQGTQSAVRLFTVQGATHYIQVAGVGGASGSLVLNATFGGILVVNSVQDNTTADNFVTLREAMIKHRDGNVSFGELGRFFTAGENAAGIRANGLCSCDTARDIIYFNPTVFTLANFQVIVLGSSLPVVSQATAGDVVSGIGAGVMIDGGGLNFDCLTISGNDNRIEGLWFIQCDGVSFPRAIMVTGSSNVIGGAMIAAQGNTLAFNSVGVRFDPPGTGNLLVGNYIGVNRFNGNAAANDVGVAVTGANNVIGGGGTTERNIISAATFELMVIRGPGATGNVIRGNYIGTNPAGTARLGASTYGVRFDTDAQGNILGGSSPGDGNVISTGSIGVGIDTGPNTIIGNRIGTNAAGTGALGNAHGVLVTSSAGNDIGGVNPGEGNTIAFSTGDGVRVIGASATGNTIRGNSIHSNGGLGVDLGADGVSANDLDDGDSSPNNLQNFPVITSAIDLGGGQARVSGTLDGPGSTTFTVDLYSTGSGACDASGHGEGLTYLTSVNATTPPPPPSPPLGVQDGIFSVIVPVSVNTTITATATDPAGNTSEFSACAVVDGDADDDGDPDTVDNCPAWPNPSQALPAWTVPASDLDCDRFTDTRESYLGTQPDRQCAFTATVNDEIHAPDGWPADMNDNRISNTIDVGVFVFTLNETNPNHPGPNNNPGFNIRHDFTANGIINTLDVGAYVFVLNKVCSPGGP
jgi:hypothetical protein